MFAEVDDLEGSKLKSNLLRARRSAYVSSTDLFVKLLFLQKLISQVTNCHGFITDVFS